MPIPDYQSMMLPILKLTGDQQEHTPREAVDAVVDAYNLSEAERNEQLQNGSKKITNRVSWARIYLTRAGLLESPKKGVYKITPRGIDVLNQSPQTINNRFLNQFEKFREYISKSRNNDEERSEASESLSTTPIENIDANYIKLRSALAAELLQRIKSGTPERFEQLVVDLLIAMGYGGSRSEAGKAVGRSGDEGIDGIINEDKLGLDVVYIQAKKWDNPVSRPEIQKFAGALAGKKANKGVFITTSQFTRDAKEYVGQLSMKIILLDGEQLAELMIDHNIGVTTHQVFEIKKIDEDYFTED